MKYFLSDDTLSKTNHRSHVLLDREYLKSTEEMIIKVIMIIF